MTNYLLKLHSTQTSNPQHSNRLLLKEHMKQNQKMSKGLMNKNDHIHV